ncbi:MAG: hypothetical protein IKL07_05280 [Clostridium sp.]|nr:hypothetical protein [Clostridium sp.]
MENIILIIVGILLIIFSIVLIAKPICYYKIQEKVMGLTGMKVEYNEDNVGRGRIVGVAVLVITVFGLIMQFS